MRINNQRIDSSGYRIIALDDDAAIVDSLATLLKKSGFEITGVTDPVEAIEKICVGKYDMLILDYMMDKMNGDKVVEKIREFNKEIYILLLTGHRDLVPPLETLKSLEIQGYCEKSDKIDQLILLIESGIKSISQMNAIKKFKDEMNDTLKLMVAQQNLELKNLLNNAGQGFMTFSKDLSIEPVFSNECINLFGRNIEYFYFPDLIYPDDEEQKELLVSLLKKAIEVKNKFKREVYLSILPKIIEVNDKFVSIDYKVINAPLNDGAEKFMLVLTDITEKRLLENQIEREKENMEMIVRAVADYDTFIGIIKEFKRFNSSMMYEILESGQPLKIIIFEIYRTMHNFKGNFGQFRMLNAVNKIQDFESAVSLLMKDLSKTNIEEFKDFIFSNDISTWLEKDLSTIKNTLGENFINKNDSIIINKQRLEELERQLALKLSPQEHMLVSDALRQLKYKPFYSLLKLCPEYITSLAEQSEKPIKAFKIEGGDFLVDTEKYRSFTNTLIHVFRNIIDHGLEPPEERLAKGKDEYGTIKCQITRNNDKITIMVCDDGRGVDFEKIKEKALKSGFIEKDATTEITNEILLNILFEEGFTTKDTVSMLSGRGMGLSIIKAETDRIGGVVQIESCAGRGTKFIFKIPVYAD